MVHEILKIWLKYWFVDVDLDLMFLNFAVKLCLAKTGLETGQEIANQQKD